MNRHNDPEWLNFLLGAVAKHAFKHPDCDDCKLIAGLRYGENEEEIVKRGAAEEPPGRR